MYRDVRLVRVLHIRLTYRVLSSDDIQSIRSAAAVWAGLCPAHHSACGYINRMKRLEYVHRRFSECVFPDIVITPKFLEGEMFTED